jgi:exonuclease 3'-5' domain-containing protein 1
LANTYDLQLLDVANRLSRNVQTRYLSGLTKCIELYVAPPNAWKEVKEAGNRLFSPEKGGSYTIFERRPLDPRILAYCAQDVALMFQLEAAMKKTMDKPEGWEKKILLGSANRVAESKSSYYSGQGRHRAIAPDL